MTAIDPTRITAIFRMLSVKPSADNVKNRDFEKLNLPEANRALSIEQHPFRDKEKLKTILRIKLKKLKENGPDFTARAPGLVIKEILLWEFGEDFINHPQFNRISEMVFHQCLLTQESRKNFFSIIDNLLN